MPVLRNDFHKVLARRTRDGERSLLEERRVGGPLRIYRYDRICPAVPPDIVYGGDTSADLAVAEGDNATLSCRATGRPPPRVSWRREDGEPIVIRASTGGKNYCQLEWSVKN